MKNSKRYYILTSFLIVSTFIFTACAFNNNTATQNLTYGGDNGLSTVEYKNLDELIKAADNIVIGRVEEEEHSMYSLYKFNFIIEKEFKGSTNANTIDVYQTYGTLNIGDTYLLFLDYFDSVYFDRPVYTSIVESSIIKITDENLRGSEKYIGDLSKNNIEKYIMNSPNIHVKKEKEYNVIDRTDSVSELVDLSDYVLHIEIQSSENINKNINRVKFNIIKEYKGNIDSTQEYFLPTYVQQGSEYIIFMKNANYRIDLATRNDSVLSKENAKWNEVLSELDNTLLK